MSNALAQNPTFATFSGATSVQVAFGAGGTNPSLYVATVTQEDPTASVTVADNRNAGNYALDRIQSVGTTGDGARASIHSIQNTSTLTATITATLGASTTGSLKTYELTGAATSGALDSVGGGTGVVANYSGSVTTISPNCTVVMCSSHYADLVVVADPNYTAAFAETAGSLGYSFGEYRVDAGAAGSITLNGNNAANSSAHFAIAIAAYKTLSGGSSAAAVYAMQQNQQ